LDIAVAGAQHAVPESWVSLLQLAHVAVPLLETQYVAASASIGNIAEMTRTVVKLRSLYLMI
jgi:hypothetical protein